MASDGKDVADQVVPGLLALLDSMDQAVIVQDATDRIQLLNTTARKWFPDLEVGNEFCQQGESFVAEPGGYRVCGRLRPLIGGWRAWVITEVTGETAGEAARQREFLLLAGR
ncbi:MAG TPA: hypothetical protein VFO16_21600, partial [Pseudonocardiaceae bacterium]|nr:hypothetical protein [Pseudonocardiaceae bacterium]